MPFLPKDFVVPDVVDAGELHQGARNVEVAPQRLGDELLRKVVAHLLHVLRIGAQDRDLAPAETRAHDQAVEAVALGAAGEYAEESVLHGRGHRGHVDVAGQRIGEIEIVHPELAPVGAHQPVGAFAEHPHPEVLEHRDHVGELDRAIGAVELEVGQLLLFAHVAVQVHAQPAVALERVEGADVGHRHRRVVVVAVAGGEGLRVEREAARALLLAEFIGKCCLLYTSPSPRDRTRSRMPSSA